MKEEKKALKSGYTTGVHASLAFARALEALLVTKNCAYCITNKVQNDDLDVTKGCEIIVKVSHDKNDLELNPLKHEAQISKSFTNILEIYAGVGVGVVTKKGLKIPPTYAAINPVPLENMQRIFMQKCKNEKNLKLFCSISVSNGEEIAKQTANAKVGVLGGISILGTKGIVKPVSATAYIDSIKTELNFAVQNECEPIFFTLGNSSLAYVLEDYEEEHTIEVANFVYDSMIQAYELKAKKVYFVAGIGKMTKVYQAFKNTHNRFGSINLEIIKDEIKEELNYEINIEETKTVKGICNQLAKVNLEEKFFDLVTKGANKQIQTWFPNSNIEAILTEQYKEKRW